MLDPGTLVQMDGFYHSIWMIIYFDDVEVVSMCLFTDTIGINRSKASAYTIDDLQYIPPPAA